LSSRRRARRALTRARPSPRAPRTVPTQPHACDDHDHEVERKNDLIAYAHEPGYEIKTR
jgi:hypothetical protein